MELPLILGALLYGATKLVASPSDPILFGIVRRWRIRRFTIRRFAELGI